jgi:hypothetical protein
MLSFLASSTFFRYAQNEGFAFKKFKIFAPSPRFLYRLTAFMDLLSHGYSKSIKAVRRQRNFD